MSEYVEDFGTEDSGAEFEAADIFAAGDVTGNPCDKDISEALIEDDLNGDSRVRAAEECGEWFLTGCECLSEQQSSAV